MLLLVVNSRGGELQPQLTLFREGDEIPGGGNEVGGIRPDG